MNMNGKIAKTVLVFGVGSAMAIAQTSNPASAQNPPADTIIHCEKAATAITLLIME